LDAAGILPRLLRDASQRVAAKRAPRLPDVALLNDSFGLPSRHEARRFAGRLDVDVYLLDFDYADRERAGSCLAEIERLRRAHGLRFEEKTLLLAARGLDPHGAALLRLAKQFRRHFVFFELWNGPAEIAELARERPEELYFLPVSAHVNLGWAAKPLSAPPNRNVFVSLGGDDDLELVREVVRARRDLRFYVPDRSWQKEDSVPREVAVGVSEPNALRVRCYRPNAVRRWWSPKRSDRQFTWAYRSALARCDTVLVATRAAKLRQMRGGIRVADAIRSRKRLVLTHNPMCEFLMAEHGRTCLVADSSVASVSDALDRTMDGRFRVDEALFEAVRDLTTDEAKLMWMTNACRDADSARRSAFWRDPATLGERLRTLPFDEVGAMPLEALFDLRRGQRFVVEGLEVRVEDINQSGKATFDLTVAIAGARQLELVLSTAPAERYFRRTGRGHFLGYRGHDVTPVETRTLERIAEHL
jgi:hypothetical protein